MSDPHAAADTPKKSGKSKLLILGLVGALLLLGGGGAAFFLLQGSAPEAAAERKDKHHDEGDAHADEGGDHGEGDGHASDEGDGHGDEESTAEDGEEEGGEHEEAAAEGGGGHGEGAGVPGANYLALDPPFIVNFQQEQGKKPRVRFLKVEVQCLTKTPAQLEVVKAHSPAIRNKLIMLFSNQRYEDLVSADGIEKLRVAALEEVKATLKKVTGKKTVKDLYFTSFVMQ